MLYRTHHPFSFSHLLSPSSPRRLMPSPAFPPPPSLQVEMERGEQGDLKHGVSRPEMSSLKKSNQQPAHDDFWSQNGISGDDFSVDDLLDFSKDGIADEIPEEREDKPEALLEKPSALSDQHVVKALSRSNLTVLDDLRSVSCDEFNVPAGGLEDLEWLSHFVDDSFSGYSLTCTPGKLPENHETDRTLPVAVVDDDQEEVKPCFTSPVQTKARSKRARTGGRVWSIGSGSLTESSTNSSTSSSSTYSSPNSNPRLIYVVPSHSQTAESLMGRPLAKKQKKKRPETTVATGPVGGCGSQAPRRCSHCLVQKTPQWRAGPLGAKTLCNACGVRYKSGRLLPEYRPACSPTFSTELHSNNHRKVMEMRRKKEADDVEEMVPPAVTSF